MFEGLFQSRSPNEERVPKGQRLTNCFPIMTYGDTPQRKPSDGMTLWKGYKQNLPLSYAYFLIFSFLLEESPRAFSNFCYDHA